MNLEIMSQKGARASVTGGKKSTWHWESGLGLPKGRNILLSYYPIRNFFIKGIKF